MKMKMKLLLAFVMFPSFVFASDLSCNPKQAAVSPRGRCMVFTTSCQVPDDWKNVPSCDMVKKVRKNNRRSIVRRGESYWNRMRESSEDTIKGRVVRRGRIGRVGAVDAVKELNKDQPLSSERRGVRKSNTFQKKLSSLRDAPEFYRNSPEIRGGAKDDTEITEKEKLRNQRKRWGGIRPRFERATEMDRSSEFSSMPRWDVQIGEHFKEKRYKGESPFWKKLDRKKKVKKARNQRRIITNRRGFKGTRLEGSLNGEILNN